MNKAIDQMSEADQKYWREDEEGRQKFFLTYEYPETEIYSAMRELRYAVPEKGPAPTYGGLHPHQNIPQRLRQMKSILHPAVAKAVLTELKRRITLEPAILDRDKKYFDAEVKKVFGYTIP